MREIEITTNITMTDCGHITAGALEQFSLVIFES